jgi:ABC-type multidrug transport system ATPase subunit
MINQESSLLLDGMGTETVLPMTFSFQNLGYTIKGKKNNPDKVLLKNISGIVKPGSVLAIMGPSGAGKTTLLDVLANRSTKGLRQGTIKINGEEFTSHQSAFRRVTGYGKLNFTFFGNYAQN